MNRTLRQLLWWTTIVIFFFASIDCSTRRTRTIEAQQASQKLPGHKATQVEGYTTRDGVYHGFEGWVIRTHPDSLTFMAEPTVKRIGGRKYSVGPGESTRFTVATSEIHDIRTVYTSTAAVVANVVGAIIVAGFIGVGIALATKESCPFLYSWDGEKYVFDGEPYGGATMSALQRTDWSQLEHLRESEDQYRLIIANEVDETQHTDALSLLVADHSPDAWPILDYEGNVHAFLDSVSLCAAIDEDGEDLMVWLRDQDHAVWYPDFSRYAAMDSLADTRNHIALVFMRPEGVERVHLVARVGTGQWGSHMIRVMLGMRGHEIGDFCEAINNSPASLGELMDWNRREDLFVLDVELQEGEAWSHVGELYGGGPFLLESRAIPIDLKGVEGDSVQLRLHPPIGFWQFDAFHLAWGEDETVVAQITPSSATDQDGHDVLALLGAEDGQTLDFPTTRESAMLVFPTPRKVPGLRRTIFASTTGWYELHLSSDQAPDLQGLQRLTYEPGYAVRLAMSEFRSFRATGKLAYTNQIGLEP
jgi:hypothetical protein